MPYFSFIVPIYNVEKYLKTCIDSILNQSFTDFEIILVDDGSPDESPVICDEYGKKDERVHIIHKENGGLSDARNAGIFIARGRYVLFVDADDLIEENSLSAIVSTIEQNGNPDVVFLEAKKIFPDGEIEAMGDGYVKERINGQSHEMVLEFIKKMPKFPGSVCTKAIKRSIIDKNQLFTTGLISEDNEWTLRLFQKAKTFAYSDSAYYLYRQARVGSISNSVSKKSILSLISIVEKHSYKYPNTKYQFFANSCCAYIMMVLLFDINNNNGLKDKEIVSKIKQKKWIFSYAATRKTKITALAISVFGIKITSRLLQIYRRIF